MSEESFIKKPVNRRTVTTAAAWTVPAVAVAVAAPAHAASPVTPAWDVTVTGFATNGADVSLLGGGLVNTVLNFLGISAATFGYTITASAGVVPAGTAFTLTTGGLVNASLLDNQLIGLTVVGISNQTVTITLDADLPTGSSVTVNLLGNALLNVGVLSTSTLTLAGNDSPAPGVEGKDSASIRVLSIVSTNAIVATVKVLAGAVVVS